MVTDKLKASFSSGIFGRAETKSVLVRWENLRRGSRSVCSMMICKKSPWARKVKSPCEQDQIGRSACSANIGATRRKTRCDSAEIGTLQATGRGAIKRGTSGL